MYARTLDAQRDIFELAEELGAGDSLRRVGLLRLAVSEEEAEHVRDHARALRRTGSPARSSSATSWRPRSAAHGPRGLPHRPRRRPPPGALVPHCSPGPRRRPARASSRAALCMGPCLRPARARCVTGRGSVRAATWWLRPTARCRRSCRSTRGGCARRRLHMVATEPLPADARPARLRALGLRVPPAAPRRAHPRGRLQRRGRRQLLHRQRRRRAADLGARRGYLRDDLGARRGREPPLGRRGRLQRRLAALRRRGARAPAACTCRAATRAPATCPASCAGATWPTRSRAMARSRCSQPTESHGRAANPGAERARGGALRRADARLEGDVRAGGAHAAGGVSSSFHGREPWPVYLARGEGARVWDADVNE